jgi:hypothetical protein
MTTTTPENTSFPPTPHPKPQPQLSADLPSTVTLIPTSFSVSFFFGGLRVIREQDAERRRPHASQHTITATLPNWAGVCMFVVGNNLQKVVTEVVIFLCRWHKVHTVCSLLYMHPIHSPMCTLTFSLQSMAWGYQREAERLGTYMIDEVHWNGVHGFVHLMWSRAGK